MLTLGIDLASQPAKTATCQIEWENGVATPSIPVIGRTDLDILAEVGRCDVIGIDAPFGWPQPFIEFVARQHAIGQELPAWTDAYRDSLRFRATDCRVQNVLGRWPLSVSSDLISVTAMRCAGLLDRLGVVDRSGDGQVYEVYPAVALAIWGFPSQGYKKAPMGAENRRNALEVLEIGHPWLLLSEDVKRVCSNSEHAFDSLVSSLTARAAAIGLTTRPTPAEKEAAQIEGWIAVPLPGSLRHLAEPMLEKVGGAVAT